MPSPTKLAHLVLRTRRFDEVVAWWRSTLEAETAFANDFIAFLTYDDEHHRIAIVRDGQVAEGSSSAPPAHPGLDHVAFTYGSFDDLATTWARLRVAGVEPFWQVNHGPTTSLYYADPDGNRVELQIDNFPDAESLDAWFRSGAFARNPIGTNIDFAEVVARHDAGEPLDSLLVREDA